MSTMEKQQVQGAAAVREISPQHTGRDGYPPMNRAGRRDNRTCHIIHDKVEQGRRWVAKAEQYTIEGKRVEFIRRANAVWPIAREER